MPVVMGPHSVLDLGALSLRLNEGMDQCATGNPVPVPVPVPVDPVDFFRSGSGPVPAKYRPDRPDLTSKFGCRI